MRSTPDYDARTNWSVKLKQTTNLPCDEEAKQSDCSKRLWLRKVLSIKNKQALERCTKLFDNFELVALKPWCSDTNVYGHFHKETKQVTL